MTVFLNKDKTELVATCKCGDEATHIVVDVDDYDCYTIMSYMNGNFYRDQGDKIHRVIERKLKKILSIIMNKDYYYSEIVMDKKDFEAFKEYINQF